MLHSRDLQKLELVLSPTHLEVSCCLKCDIFYMFLEVIRQLALYNPSILFFLRKWNSHIPLGRVSST